MELNRYNIITTRYVNRREIAMSPRNIGPKGVPYVLSFIIDIMDQSKCQVPALGLLNSFPDPFKQMIVGVKVMSLLC